MKKIRLGIRLRLKRPYLELSKNKASDQCGHTHHPLSTIPRRVNYYTMNYLLLDQGHQMMGHKHGHKRLNPQEKGNNPCRPAYMVTGQVTDLVTNNMNVVTEVTTSQSEAQVAQVYDNVISTFYPQFSKGILFHKA